MQRVSFVSCETLTQAEFSDWLETLPASDIHRYELLEGRIVMEPPASWPHGEIEARIVHALVAFVRTRAQGRVFGSSQGFELPSGDTVEPDATFVSTGRWEAQGVPRQGFPGIVPDLVVEILSPSTKGRDRGQKKRIYERAGVREYWLVDPESRSVTRLVATQGRFGEGRVLAQDDRLESVTLDGFEVPVSELFPAP
ncbi:MAG: Uma2 family endonuclease [Planctomycetota bacterium]